jgi:hypothetical protein
MRRLATAVLVVGLLALGLAAAVDALHGDATRSAAPGETVDVRTIAALRAAGARGTLTYSDEGCRLHAVRLPELTSASAPGYTMCEPRSPTGGITTWEGDVVWAGLGFRTVQVVLPHERIDRAVSRRLGLGGGLGLRPVQAVSLGPGRYCALAEGDARDDYLVFFRHTRLIVVYALGDGEHALRASPAAAHIALLTKGARVQIFTPEGAPERLPAAASPHAVAWSPDDRWTALASRDSVFVFPTDRPEETIRLPLAVRDLDWET